VKHRGDPVEHLFACVDVRGGDVAPRDGHAEGGASFAGAAEGGGEAEGPIAAAAAVPLGDVEADGAEGAAELGGEVAVEASDPKDNGAEEADGLEGDLEDDEG
jgi:hypothetical protein